MKIVNDCFNLVVKAAKTLYPNSTADIYFDDTINPEEFCGETTFPYGGSDPIIRICTNIPFDGIVETMAHEIAHVVTSEDIHNKYIELLNEIVDGNERSN
jgi:hypothetical protein